MAVQRGGHFLQHVRDVLLGKVGSCGTVYLVKRRTHLRGWGQLALLLGHLGLGPVDRRGQDIDGLDGLRLVLQRHLLKAFGQFPPNGRQGREPLGAEGGHRNAIFQERIFQRGYLRQGVDDIDAIIPAAVSVVIISSIATFAVVSTAAAAAAGIFNEDS